MRFRTGRRMSQCLRSSGVGMSMKRSADAVRSPAPNSAAMSPKSSDLVSAYKNAKRTAAVRNHALRAGCRATTERARSRTAVSARLHHVAVHVRAAIAVELPGVADLANQVEVEIGHEQLLLLLRRLRDDLPSRVREVARAVVLVRPELLLLPDAVDRPHPIAVRDRVRGLLDEPEMHRESPRRRGGDEDKLGAVQPEHARALGEMAVVADVDADLADGGLEDGVPEVAWPEVELLPEAVHVRDVGLAVLAEVAAVRVDDRGGVVVDAGLVLLVHRHDEHHAVLARELLHELRGGTVRDLLRVAVVLAVLHLAEVRPVEELLKAHHLRPLLGRVGDVGGVLLDHGVLVARPRALDERRPNSCHLAPSLRGKGWREASLRATRPSGVRGCMAGVPPYVALTARRARSTHEVMDRRRPLHAL